MANPAQPRAVSTLPTNAPISTPNDYLPGSNDSLTTHLLQIQLAVASLTSMVQDQAPEIRELLQLICSIRQLKTTGHHLKMTGLIVVRLITCHLKMTSIFVGILMTYVCISLQTKYVVLR